MSSEIMVWGGFFALFFLLISLDLLVFHRGARVVTFPSAVAWTCFWVSLGTGFSGSRLSARAVNMRAAVRMRSAPKT